MLQHLEIRAVRNISEAVLGCAANLNLIVGANASGKTSLLEAIHLLGLARSFRTTRVQNFIQHGAEEATVFGRVGQGEAVIAVGVAKRRDGEGTIRIGGRSARSLAELAALLPLQVITPASHFLVEAGPKQRRAFLDWGLFHVEQSYYPLWQRYVRALKQRNAALRSGSTNAPWERGLAESGEAISALRERYVGALIEPLARYLGLLLPQLPLEVRYGRGWAGEHPLAQALAQSGERDRTLGFTGVGPHRADLRLLVSGRLAGEVLSRGQQKLLVLALRLAQVALLAEQRGKRCVVLIDDLPAELDTDHRAKVMALLAELQAQVFVTATEPGLIDTSAWSDHRMFHVEHGQVQEVV